MHTLKYLNGYPAPVKEQVQTLISNHTLADFLLKKYPIAHETRSNKALYNYVMGLKNQFIRKSEPLSKVIYDDKLDVLHQALGLHSFVARVQGGKLKTK